MSIFLLSTLFLKLTNHPETNVFTTQYFAINFNKKTDS